MREERREIRNDLFLSFKTGRRERVGGVVC